MITPLESTPLIDSISILEIGSFNLQRYKPGQHFKKIHTEMYKHPKINITVESHTDSRGTSSYNKGLSERRAKSTVQYVISKGINEDRLKAIGMGEEVSLFDCSKGCNEEQHSQNRRSEFIIE